MRKLRDADAKLCAGKNPEAEKDAIPAANLAAGKLPESGSLRQPCEAICRTLEGDKLSDEDAAAFEKNLVADEIPARSRCTYNCFLGMSLELAGDPQRAKEYYQRARDLFRANPSLLALAAKHFRQLDNPERRDDKQRNASTGQ